MMSAGETFHSRLSHIREHEPQKPSPPAPTPDIGAFKLAGVEPCPTQVLKTRVMSEAARHVR